MSLPVFRTGGEEKIVYANDAFFTECKLENTVKKKT
jgi:hypothetical protein